MKKRLIANYNAVDLETEYTKLINKTTNKRSEEGSKLYKLFDHKNDDSKTFLIRPGGLLVDYDDNQVLTEPHPGEQGFVSQDMRWIGR